MSSVKPFLIDVLEHLLRHHISYGLAVFEVVANEGGRECHERGIHEVDMGVVAEVAAVVAGAGIDVEVVVFEDVLVVEPFGEGLQVVFTHDEAELALGVLFAQHLQRVARVGGFRERELDVAGPETEVIADGEVDEMQPLAVVEQRSFFLERVLRRHHEPEFLQVRVFQQILGNNHVPDVYRVERSEV